MNSKKSRRLPAKKQPAQKNMREEMNPIQIDPELCQADELCVRECPLSVLTVESKGSVPFVSPSKIKHCINCGHCAAVCPTNAITLTALADQSPLKIDADEIINFKDVEKLIKTRRSIRKFKKTPVPVEQIESLIHLAAYAPSGHNVQPVSWTVFDTPEKVQELAEAVIEWMEEMVERKDKFAKRLFLSGLVNAYRNGKDIICRNAPAVAIAWAPEKGVTPQIDGVVATTYLEIAAHAQGLGTCWAGYVVLAASYSEKVRSFIGLPEGHRVSRGMFLGQPAVKYRNIPPRYEAKPEESGNKIIFPARKSNH